MPADLSLLRPKVKTLAESLTQRTKENGIDIIITQAYRSKEEQDELYAAGRTKPGRIVTNARGGYSFHNYGVAFDFAPIINGAIPWSNIGLFKQVGAIGKQLGLEWGGDWTRFRDYPHFQYTSGYSINDFLTNRVHWHSFADNDPFTTNTTTTMKLIKNQSSNKVYAVGHDNKKYWIFNEETLRTGQELGLWGGFDQIEIMNDDGYQLGHTIILVK